MVVGQRRRQRRGSNRSRRDERDRSPTDNRKHGDESQRHGPLPRDVFSEHGGRRRLVPSPDRRIAQRGAEHAGARVGEVLVVFAQAAIHARLAKRALDRPLRAKLGDATSYVQPPTTRRVPPPAALAHWTKARTGAASAAATPSRAKPNVVWAHPHRAPSRTSTSASARRQAVHVLNRRPGQKDCSATSAK